MVSFAVPKWIIISTVVFIFMSLVSVFYFMLLYFKERKSDKTIVIDKSNKWNLYSEKTTGKKKIKLGGLYYRLDAEGGGGLLSSKGKSLHIFSWNIPTPMKIRYNKDANWLTSESMEAAIQNEVVQKIVRPTDSVKEMLITLGIIASFIAMASSVTVLLIVTGVIKGGVV